ncbi:NUDIX hydrolase [Candidatus Pacearchaeota archaeon]|nr:NUDIX hydrolase [Candidatus Pacearchaeota archaeon]
MSKGFLSESEYKFILERVPIVTVEAVITRNNRRKKEFLLAKRTRIPEKGLFHVIGGRLFLGENTESAIKRVLERETSVKNFKSKFIAIDTLFAKESEAGPGFQALSCIFEVKTKDKIILNRENSEFKWLSKIDDTVAENARRIISHVQR